VLEALTTTAGGITFAQGTEITGWPKSVISSLFSELAKLSGKTLNKSEDKGDDRRFWLS
jgi:hypothetical protein